MQKEKRQITKTLVNSDFFFFLSRGIKKINRYYYGLLLAIFKNPFVEGPLILFSSNFLFFGFEIYALKNLGKRSKCLSNTLPNKYIMFYVFSVIS